MLNGMRTLDEYLSLESDLVLPELPEADQRRMHKELMLCISNFDRCVDNARQDYRDDAEDCGSFLRGVGRVVVGGATGCALGACYESVVPGPGTAAGTLWGCTIGALSALTGGEMLCIKDAKDDLHQKLRDCSTALDVCIDEYELRWF